MTQKDQRPPDDDDEDNAGFDYAKSKAADEAAGGEAVTFAQMQPLPPGVAHSVDEDDDKPTGAPKKGGPYVPPKSQQPVLTTQPPIQGYRNLSTDEITVINDIKTAAASIERLIDHLGRNTHYDQRWVSLAKTHLQQGFMAAVRSVAKPEGF
jgi:hypothetical protein